MVSFGIVDDGALLRFERLGQDSVQAALGTLDVWAQGWQAVASHMAAYSQRMFDDGVDMLERSIAASSVEEVLELHGAFAQRSHDQHLEEVSAIGDLYARYAVEAYRPVEKALKHIYH